MTRQNPIQFVPSSVGQIAPNRDAEGAFNILAQVASLAGKVIQTKTESIQKDNVKAEAYAKLEQLSTDNQFKQDVQQYGNEIDKETREARMANKAAAEYDDAVAGIQRTETHGAPGVVAGLTLEQLESANASGLGFEDPSAITLVNKSIGERRAESDFSTIKNILANDLSKTPTQLLGEFVDRQDPNNPTTLYYKATLAKNLRGRIDDAVLENAKRSRKIGSDTTVNQFQADFLNNFNSMTSDSFNGILLNFNAGIESHDPRSTPEERKVILDKALRPLLLGDTARKSASDTIMKFEKVFAGREDEIEMLGLGNLVHELRAAANGEKAEAHTDRIKGINNDINGSLSVGRLQSIEQSTLSDETLSPSDKGIISKNINDKIKTVKLTEDVNRRASGEAVSLTDAHNPEIQVRVDKLMTSFVSEANAAISHGMDPKIAQVVLRENVANVYQHTLTTYNRITPGMIDSLNADINAPVGPALIKNAEGLTQAVSSDVRFSRLTDALSNLKSIQDFSPSYLNSIANGDKGSLNKKAQTMIHLFNSGTTRNELFNYAEVPNDVYEIAAESLLSNKKDEKGVKIEGGLTAYSQSINSLQFMLGEFKPNTIMPGNVKKMFTDLVTANLALGIFQSGVVDPGVAYNRAATSAIATLKKNTSVLKIDGFNYIVPSREFLGEYNIDVNDKEEMKIVNTAFDKHVEDVQTFYPNSIVTLDISNKQSITKEVDGVVLSYVRIPVVVNGIAQGINSDLSFDYRIYSDDEKNRIIGDFNKNAITRIEERRAKGGLFNQIGAGLDLSGEIIRTMFE